MTNNDKEENDWRKNYPNKNIISLYLILIKNIYIIDLPSLFRYAVSDALSNIYNFELKDGHMPSNNDPLPITIISPNAISMEPRMPRGRHQQSNAYENLKRGKDNGPYASRDYRYQEVSRIWFLRFCLGIIMKYWIVRKDLFWLWC